MIVRIEPSRVQSRPQDIPCLARAVVQLLVLLARIDVAELFVLAGSGLPVGELLNLSQH